MRKRRDYVPFVKVTGWRRLELSRQTSVWKEHHHWAKKRDMGMLRITIAETLSEQRDAEGRLVQPGFQN